MEKLNDLRTQLMSFNSDPIVSRIREKYNTPSFFEMIDKTRSETAHSAFLSWMLKGQGISETTADTPLYLFLSVLTKRSLQQETAGTLLMNQKVRDAILSRKIRLSNVETETEKSVSELAELAYDSCDSTTDADRCSYLSQIIANIADRVDIVAKCNVENCDGIKQLILVIENKIDSPEGKAKATAKRKKSMPDEYTKLSQTERYYRASYQKSTSDTAVIYVFLTPKTTESDFAGIQSNRNTLKKEGKIAQSDNYININYQDILNGVIDNALLLQEGSITQRTRNFLEEYKNEITYPHIDNPKTHLNIAYPQIDGIEDLWERFRFLFHSIVYSTVSNKGCVAVENDSDTSYYATSNRVNIPDSLQQFFSREEQKTTSIDKFCEVLSQNGSQSQPINSDTLQSADVLNLLSEFADENLEIMSTIIGAVKFSSPKYASEADELFKVLMSGARDNTKYFVAYNGKSLTPKPVSKSEVAYLMFRKWAEENNATIEQMRVAFPVEVNPYYVSGKYFQHLFYSYSPNNKYYFDGNDQKFGKSVPCTGVWDFYHDNQHEYCGMTNLKMWRKDAFESLIVHVKNNLGDYAKYLSIEDTLGNQIL
ncbi:MAG: PD-(D/E)XK nuclease family protein [Paludibacteraceae bacterium]|nr:PD-(D/E)XK nuclease family protein [Paludibacteraceae bacterium]